MLSYWSATTAHQRISPADSGTSVCASVAGFPYRSLALQRCFSICISTYHQMLLHASLNLALSPRYTDCLPPLLKSFVLPD